ncbi:MAG: hypothetical protein WCT37_03370 [Patescibacteria group bacterium]
MSSIDLRRLKKAMAKAKARSAKLRQQYRIKDYQWRKPVSTAA